MTNSETPGKLRFDPPGPGSWGLDPVHFPRPVTRYFAETHPAGFKRGTNDFARFYGMLYRRHGNASTSTALPTTPWCRRRRRTFPNASNGPRRSSTRSCGGSSCASGTRRPSRRRSPSTVTFRRVDPDALSDQQLVDYLTRCRDHHAAMMAQHMRFTAGAMIPTGDFVAHVGDWTGLPPAELLGLLRGSAAVSAGGSAELERLVAAVGNDAAALDLLNSGEDPAQVLAALRSLGGEQGTAVSDYLDFVGYRPLDGFDISEPRRPRVARRPGPGHPHRRGGHGTTTPRPSRTGRPTSATRCPSRTGTSSTSCWGRPGSPTGSATSAASTATSGPRG